MKTSIGPKSAPLLQREVEAFLRQSLSGPCVNTIARANGIRIEDLDGCKYMDFQGIPVHHIGYGRGPMFGLEIAVTTIRTNTG